MRLEAKNYLDIMVRPTYEEFSAEPWSFRKALLATVAMSHMVDYWAMEAYEGDSSIKAMGAAVAAAGVELFLDRPYLIVIWHVADAVKHRRLAKLKEERPLKGVDQLEMPLGFFNAPFGQGNFAEAMDVFLRLDGETQFSARRDLKSALEFWEAKVTERSS